MISVVNHSRSCIFQCRAFTRFRCLRVYNLKNTMTIQGCLQVIAPIKSVFQGNVIHIRILNFVTRPLPMGASDCPWLGYTPSSKCSGVQCVVVRTVDPLYNNTVCLQCGLCIPYSAHCRWHAVHVQCPTVGALNAHCTPTALRAGLTEMYEI